MSTQKGNHKKRAPKHKNVTAFKNNLHDSSIKTQIINNIQVTQCCARCTEIIQWKIKYKKYKPLTTPKKCTRCQGKTIKRAYCILCEPCATENHVCMKCGELKDIVQEPGMTEEEEAMKMAQLEQELKYLPERKRRTFKRLQESGKLCTDEKIKDELKSESDEESDETFGDNEDRSLNSPTSPDVTRQVKFGSLSEAITNVSLDS